VVETNSCHRTCRERSSPHENLCLHSFGTHSSGGFVARVGRAAPSCRGHNHGPYQNTPLLRDRRRHGRGIILGRFFSKGNRGARPCSHPRRFPLSLILQDTAPIMSMFDTLHATWAPAARSVGPRPRFDRSFNKTTARQALSTECARCRAYGTARLCLRPPRFIHTVAPDRGGFDLSADSSVATRLSADLGDRRSKIYPAPRCQCSTRNRDALFWMKSLPTTWTVPPPLSVKHMALL